MIHNISSKMMAQIYQERRYNPFCESLNVTIFNPWAVGLDSEVSLSFSICREDVNQATYNMLHISKYNDHQI